MGAKANRTYLSFVKEATWGVTPDTPAMQKINFTGESFAYEKDTSTSESIRSDRQTADVIPLSGGATGGFDFEVQALQSGVDDPLLVGVLWSSGWAGGDGSSIDAEGATIDVTLKIIDFTAATGGDPGLIAGQLFYLAGTGVGDNYGVYTVETVDGAGVYTIAETFALTGALAADSLAYAGQYIKNGITLSSFTFERGHEDVSEYFNFAGMSPNEATISFEAGAVLTSQYGFIGKTATVGASVADSFVDAPTTPFLSSGYNVSDVEIDGVAVPACELMSLEIEINNNVESKLGVGVFDTCAVSEGEFEVTGNISLYFNDSSNFQDFLDNRPKSISFQISDNLGNIYIYKLPRIIITADPVNAESKNSDVMDNAEFTATRDPATDAMIQITRFAIA